VVLRQLVLHTYSLFIWAVTACRFICEGKRFAYKRLDTILKGSSSAITALEKHLNKIYLAVLKYSLSAEYSDEESEKVYNILKYILGSIVTWKYSSTALTSFHLFIKQAIIPAKGRYQPDI
jgi:hypothetical protein